MAKCIFLQWLNLTPTVRAMVSRSPDSAVRRFFHILNGCCDGSTKAFHHGTSSLNTYYAHHMHIQTVTLHTLRTYLPAYQSTDLPTCLPTYVYTNARAYIDACTHTDINTHLNPSPLPPSLPPSVRPSVGPYKHTCLQVSSLTCLPICLYLQTHDICVRATFLFLVVFYDPSLALRCPKP